MLLTTFISILCIDLGLTIRTKRSIDREKRDACSLNRLFSMERKKDDNEYKVDLNPGLVDRMLIHNFDFDNVCNSNKMRDLEIANRIYVLNNQEEHSRKKRSAYGGEYKPTRYAGEAKPRTRRSLGDMQKHEKQAIAGGLLRSDPVDQVRMIERIAVRIDQLDKHLHMAAQMLDSKKVQQDRQLVAIYKDRMKSLLKSKLQLTIKENQIMLNSMENIKLPKQFHR